MRTLQHATHTMDNMRVLLDRTDRILYLPHVYFMSAVAVDSQRVSLRDLIAMKVMLKCRMKL